MTTIKWHDTPEGNDPTGRDDAQVSGTSPMTQVPATADPVAAAHQELADIVRIAGGFPEHEPLLHARDPGAADLLAPASDLSVAEIPSATGPGSTSTPLTFEHALHRTAQLAYDLEFDGVPYLYSWPSKGEESGYLYDRDSADRARTYFLQFLGKIAHETKAKKIHIIAHSMGTRPLLEALRTDHGRTARQLRIGEVILAAPDIDADVFRDIAMTIAGAAQGMTLYASANDRALKASKAIAGGKPRAGDVPASGPVVTPGIETVDITEAGPDSIMGLNHTTYAERSHVLSDMWLLLKEGVHRAAERGRELVR